MQGEPGVIPYKKSLYDERFGNSASNENRLLKTSFVVLFDINLHQILKLMSIRINTKFTFQDILTSILQMFQ